MKYHMLLLIAAICLTSCGATGEEESRLTAEARERAEIAAAKVVASDSVGLMHLQDCVLHAKSVQSEYMLLGDTTAADTFDAAFHRYVKQHNPRLASELFNAATAHKH